jgi:hypothetical protein
MSERSGVKFLQDALLTALTVEVAPLGFVPKTKQQKFIRVVGDCTWVVHVSFAKHRHDVDAAIDLGVLLSPVEQLFTNTGSHQWGSATIGAELGNLVDRRPRRWTIEKEADAARVASEMRSEIAKFGIDWLQRFSRLEVVYATLLANDLESRLIMPLQAKRCLLLVALALLLRTKEEARRVSLECRSFLTSRAEPMLSVFDEQATRLLEA